MGLFNKKTTDSKTETNNLQKTTITTPATRASSAVQNLVQKATSKFNHTMPMTPEGDYLPIKGKVINNSSFNSSFTADPTKGNRLNIAAENYSDTPVTLIVKENNKVVQKIQLAKSKGTVFKANITDSINYDVQLTGVNNEKFSTFIKARLFNE